MEHLVGYSTADPAIFKVNQLEPIKDLKLLVRDYSVGSTRTYQGHAVTDHNIRQPIAKNALTILINLSEDKEIVEYLIKDEVLVESLLSLITVC